MKCKNCGEEVEPAPSFSFGSTAVIHRCKATASANVRLHDEVSALADKYYPMDPKTQDAETYDRQCVAWQAFYFGYRKASNKVASPTDVASRQSWELAKEIEIIARYDRQWNDLIAERDAYKSALGFYAVGRLYTNVGVRSDLFDDRGNKARQVLAQYDTSLKPHKWSPLKESKGVYGYHRYECVMCGKETHIGLDIDYEAPECPGSLPEGHILPEEKK